MKYFKLAIIFLSFSINLASATERKVIYVHTDLLGTPIAYSDDEISNQISLPPNSPDEVNATVSFVGDITVSWPDVPLASSYKITLIYDKTCGQIIQERVISSTETTFTYPGKGDFAATVAACSENCSSPTQSDWVNTSKALRPANGTVGISSVIGGACSF